MPPKRSALYASAELMSIDEVVKMLEHQEALTEALKKFVKDKEDKIRESAVDLNVSQGKSAIPWSEFKRAMRRELVPEHVCSKLREKFEDFKMTPDMTAAEYYHKFNEKSRNQALDPKIEEWRTGLEKRTVSPFSIHIDESVQFDGRWFVVVYLDAILVYSKILEDHLVHLRQIIEILRAQKLYGKMEKCTFFVDSVVFLGYVVSRSGVSVDQSKVEAIKSWSSPKTVTEVKSFHGLASFHWRFIQYFSTVTSPITECLKKGPFVWSEVVQGAFEEIKRRLCNCLYVPKYSVWELLVREVHGGGLAEHFGIQKTLEVLREHFYWPKMQGDVHNIVSKCVTCHIAKISFKPGEYTPLPVPVRPWEDVSIDFIVALACTHWGKDTIMVVVDRFSKMAHFVACHKTDDASGVAYLKVGTKLLFSTSHHPQTDGQTEVTNRILGTILQGLVSKTQKDLDLKLAHAEFAYNRSPTFATTHSPLEVVYELNPYLPLDLIPLPKGELVHKDAKSKLKAMIKLHEQVRDRIMSVNEVYKKKLNKQRRQKLFEPGDLVWIHLRKEHFPSKSKNKLMPRAEGPYKIVAKVNNNAYKVELPGDYRVHATFNVGDLSPYLDDDGIAQLRTIPFKGGRDDPEIGSSNEDDEIVLNVKTLVDRSSAQGYAQVDYLGSSSNSARVVLIQLGVE
ncbi:uncharacterized protein LOC141640914 [Silene latifolia]|uniref:uncharacterized protein LOC141640914 n=1 Tax=Silene latifolia TaxID=37657 RepID=UPI003D7727FA